MTERPQKITFGEMRDMGVLGLLIYCADYRCSHSVAVSAQELTLVAHIGVAAGLLAEVGGLNGRMAQRLLAGEPFHSRLPFSILQKEE